MIRYVAPFLPLPDHRTALQGFDWPEAIRMLGVSVDRVGGDLRVLTDQHADVAAPALRYATQERQLMLWVLEVCAAYLASDDFDCDTVMLDADVLVFENLSRWFHPAVDFGVLVRELDPRDVQGFPILNGVQFWAHHAKGKLADFYQQALAYARTLPEPIIRWGADTVALQDLLAPLTVGAAGERHGLAVRFYHADDVLERLSGDQIRQMQTGQRVTRHRPVLDFRNARKLYMADVFARCFEATA